MGQMILQAIRERDVSESGLWLLHRALFKRPAAGWWWQLIFSF